MILKYKITPEKIYKIAKVIMITSAFIGITAVVFALLISPFYGVKSMQYALGIEAIFAVIFYISMHYYFKYK